VTHVISSVSYFSVVTSYIVLQRLGQDKKKKVLMFFRTPKGCPDEYWDLYCFFEKSAIKFEKIADSRYSKEITFYGSGARYSRTN